MIKGQKRLLKKILNQLFLMINDHYYNSFLKKNIHIIKNQNFLVDLLPGENILIMAPHVDDEILGCGGALLKYLKQDKSVSIVYLTDGAKKKVNSEDKDIASTRVEEAKHVAELIQIPMDRTYFLEAEDGNLKNSFKEEQLSRILSSIRPDVIFLPSPMDTHQDHVNSSLLLLRASEIDPELNNALYRMTTVYFYDVQSPTTQMYSNVTLNTENEEDDYRKLLLAFPSQGDLTRFGLLLHRYYGKTFGLKSAEALIKIPFDRFSGIISQFHKDFEFRSRNLKKFENHMTFIKSHKSSLKVKEILKIFLT